MIKVNKNGNWKFYWGENRPLPTGAKTLGVVELVDGSSVYGALIQMRGGKYMRGYRGHLSNLPQDQVEQALAASQAAAAMGSKKSARKAITSAENGKKGGRPKGKAKAQAE